MASFAAEFCIQESLGYILRHHWADNARPKHQNIHIVVLHALMRGIVIVAQPGADALEFVRGDGNAHAAAANENAALGFPGTEIFSHQNGVIRIIVRFAGLKGSDIVHGVAEFLNKLDQFPFHIEPRVISADRNPHGPCTRLPPHFSTLKVQSRGRKGAVSPTPMRKDQTRIRVPHLQAKKQSGQKISMLTAYDATMARLLDLAGIDVLLVGDSLGTVIFGYETTLPVTLDMIIHHTKAVANGAKHALIVADMPFLTYQASIPDAVRNAGRILQEGGAAAVKLEGGLPVAETVERLVSIGIPVMGHLGLTPQAVHRLGGFRAVGKTRDEADLLVEDAHALERAGAFAVVLESVPEDVAERITSELKIPTIGIGAGVYCDGQVLVSYDALGLFDTFVPRFVKQYAKLGELVIAAAEEYISDVEAARFPAPEHTIRALSRAK